MKYAPSLYAKAFWETKPDSKQFLSVVEKNGDFSRLNKIVQAIERLAAKEEGGHMVELEFARETDASNKFKFGPKDRVRVSINPSLVAGVRITIDGTKELDSSFTRKVNQLFT